MSFKSFVREKFWPFLVGMGSTIVMMLAFFIPSLQDQYDRYQARKIITQYEQLGDEFYAEEKYDMAEQAYEKAFELSENKRLEIEIKRLTARINKVNINPRWGDTLPEELEEVDFQYVLHLLKGKDKTRERIYALNSYGIFLAAGKKPLAAEAAFKEAMQLDSADIQACINLGNLYDQQGKEAAAMEYYLRALSKDTQNARAHYNLGLLYAGQGHSAQAKKELELAIRYDSSDTDAKKQYEMLFQQKSNGAP